MDSHYLAFDLGAESGRLMLGTVTPDRLSLREVARFPNRPLRLGDSIHWNIPELFENARAALINAGQLGLRFESISTDSWGLDYLLYDRSGRIISPTFHYRDPRTQRGVSRTFQIVSSEEIFAETGIQFMPINTLFQLAAEDPSRLATAELLLDIAGGLNHVLCGSREMDITNASTFQLYNPMERNWSEKLIGALGLPRRIFPALVLPGTELGQLKGERFPGDLAGLPLVACCSHDTGSAVMGVPGLGTGWAYISSGTWSLLGVERQGLVLTEECHELNFTNEIGWNNTIRLLKNVSGLWLIQECLREWQQQGIALSYADLAAQCEGVQPFRSLINPMASVFLSPTSMLKAIEDHCSARGEAVPRAPGEFARCIYESLACLYRYSLEQLERLTGDSINRIYVVGGGSQNRFLNQSTADVTGREVLAGPVEATAVGNIIAQAIAGGVLANLQTARELVSRSFSPERYRPRGRGTWEMYYARFETLMLGAP